MSKIKYNYLTNKTDYRYIDYWFIRKMLGGRIPSEPVSGEGTNFTIDSPNNRQLKNIVAKGNTFQQTYSGKNLFDKNNAAQILHNMYIHAQGIGYNNGFLTVYIPCVENTVYTISKVLTSRFSVGTTSSTPAEGVIVSSIVADNSATKITYTTGVGSLYLVVQVRSASDTLTDDEIAATIQIEQGSQATTYEPYVGGVPAPNPDYPQTVQVATGEQSVKINNDVYKLSLGTIELCKIGDYQDSIYKSGDKWYAYKIIQKYIISGDETINIYQSNVADLVNLFTAVPFVPQGGGICTHAIYNPVQVNVSTTITYGEFALQLSGTQYNFFLKLPGSSYTPQTAQDWFKSNQTTVYYPLATPTDTEITDTTLVTQLNNLLSNGHLVEGTNTITITNDGTDLPLIIRIEA